MKIKVNILAFSIIELSIVLIIIGLLVAAIIGGTSLIESATVRGAINELENWKRSFNTFVCKGKFPGDVDDNGCIGRGWGTGCGGGSTGYTTEASSTKFGGEYSGRNVGWISGPFVDMYLEGTNNFKPDISRVYSNDENLANVGKNRPLLNNFGNSYLGFKYITIRGLKDLDEGSARYMAKDGIYMESWVNGGNLLDVGFLEKIDQKIDDSAINLGNFRYLLLYDNKNNPKKTTDGLLYKVF